MDGNEQYVRSRWSGVVFSGGSSGGFISADDGSLSGYWNSEAEAWREAAEFTRTREEEIRQVEEEIEQLTGTRNSLPYGSDGTRPCQRTNCPKRSEARHEGAALVSNLVRNAALEKIQAESETQYAVSIGNQYAWAKVGRIALAALTEAATQKENKN